MGAADPTADVGGGGGGCAVTTDGRRERVHAGAGTVEASIVAAVQCGARQCVPSSGRWWTSRPTALSRSLRREGLHLRRLAGVVLRGVLEHLAVDRPSPRRLNARPAVEVLPSAVTVKTPPRSRRRDASPRGWCPDCGNEWGGLAVAHCAACCLHVRSDSAFDCHERFSDGVVRCLATRRSRDHTPGI